MLGTGKTFTMEGVLGDEELRGIMPNTFYYIFEYVDKHMSSNLEFLVYASFLEIYNNEVYDLLNHQTRSKMELKESADKVAYVKDLSKYPVKNVDETLKVLRKGQNVRVVGATKMNPGSSRSHSVFSITIETCETGAAGVKHYRVGKLNLVDLAGSERQKKTEAQGDRLQEAKAINLSLSALGNVIKALVSGKATHIPFRDSKLTRLLQDSLGGNTKTVMVANFGPAASNFDETVSTLRYADRAKQIKNKPRINEDPKDTMIRQYLNEIFLLKQQLEARKNGQAVPLILSPETTHSVFQNVETLVEEVVVEKVVSKTIDVTDEIMKQKELEMKKQMQVIEEVARKEKEAMMAKQTVAERAAQEYEEKLRLKNDQLNTERLELEKLEQQIRDKEKNLIHGGQVMEKAAKQNVDLQLTEQKLVERQQAEERLKQDLKAAEENEMYMNHQFESQQQELDMKTASLKRLFEKYKQREAALAELQEEFAAEKEELMDNLRELTQQIRLSDLILESYVPLSILQLIEERAEWDSAGDCWLIPGTEFAGNNMMRNEPSEHDYKPPPVSVERLARLLHGTSFDPARDMAAISSPQMQEIYLSAAAALELDAPPIRDPFFSYGIDPEKQQRKFDKRVGKSYLKSVTNFKK